MLVHRRVTIYFLDKESPGEIQHGDAARILSPKWMAVSGVQHYNQKAPDPTTRHFHLDMKKRMCASLNVSGKPTGN